MEIKISTRQILKILQVLSWIIFIGLCVEAGGIVCSTIYIMATNPAGTHKFWFWDGIDLSALYAYDHGYFLVITLLMGIVSVLKAILFYLIVKLFTENKLNMAQPFSFALRVFLSGVVYLSLGIGLFSHCGAKYGQWLQQYVRVPDPQSLHIGGADVWLFMAVVLFVVAQIIKRGIEIQNEHELTI